MRILPAILSLIVAIWAALAIATHNAPSNPDAADLEIHCRYGLCEDRDMATLARLRSFQTDVALDPAQLRALLRQAPASPELWCDLGEALAEQRQNKEASEAFRHALSLAPNSPPVLFRAATFNLLAGSADQALPLFQHIFAIYPDYPAENVFSICSRFGVSTAQTLAAVLPADQPTAAAAYLRFLMRANRAGDASQVWLWITSHSLSTQPLASEYAAFLLNQKSYGPAYEVWSAGRHTSKLNRVYNPGFELATAAPGPPFDWQFDPLPDGAANIAVDPEQHHSGSHSLRVQFTGKLNVAFSNVSQRLVVAPGRYSFSVWSKTDNLTTDHGIHFAIVDAERPGPPLWISEPDLLGSSDWTQTSASITIPNATPCIRIVLVRTPSEKINSKISGAVWLDDFELRSLTP